MLMWLWDGVATVGAMMGAVHHASPAAGGYSGGAATALEVCAALVRLLATALGTLLRWLEHGVAALRRRLREQGAAQHQHQHTA